MLSITLNISSNYHFLLLILFNLFYLIITFDNVEKESPLVWDPRTSLCDRLGINALGMESGAIEDSSIQASSSYNEQSVGPQFARLNLDISGGAWCPMKQLDIENSGTEWIQVNFTDRYVITDLSTQGRFGNGLGVEFIEEYWIEYSRDSGYTWHKWKNRKGSNLLKGNTDTYTEVTNHLELPIVGANAIRILPYAQHSRTVCLRFELYGCHYKDGPIMYSMPDGYFGGRFGDLMDESYDGSRIKNYLSDGLGQLIDGIKGHENLKVNSGYEWISWKAQNETIEIIFQFPEIRNFTSAKFTCHNLFRKSMEVFSSAKVYFSFDNLHWSKVPLEFEYMPDHIMESPRDVVIHLNHKLGRFIKFSLKFASKWLSISEVSFNSLSISGSYNPNIADLESLSVSQAALEPIVNVPETNVFLFIAIGIIILIAIVLASFFGVRFWQTRRKINNFYPVDIDYIGSNTKVTTPVYCEPGDVNEWRDQQNIHHLPHHQLLQKQKQQNKQHLSHHTSLSNQSHLLNNHQHHEYAVPDVVYQNGITQHLITNPMTNIKFSPSNEPKIIKDTIIETSNLTRNFQTTNRYPLIEHKYQLDNRDLLNVNVLNEDNFNLNHNHHQNEHQDADDDEDEDDHIDDNENTKINNDYMANNDKHSINIENNFNNDYDEADHRTTEQINIDLNNLTSLNLSDLRLLQTCDLQRYRDRVKRFNTTSSTASTTNTVTSLTNTGIDIREKRRRRTKRK